MVDDKNPEKQEGGEKPLEQCLRERVTNLAPAT